jgi:hypothetical protein
MDAIRREGLVAETIQRLKRISASTKFGSLYDSGELP